MKTKKLADFQICISVTLRLSQLAIEHSLVVMTAGSQSRKSQIESYGYPISDFHFIKFEFRISGGIKFWDLSWGFRYKCFVLYKKSHPGLLFSQVYGNSCSNYSRCLEKGENIVEGTG